MSAATTIELPWPPNELSPNARLDRRRVAGIRARYRRDCHVATRAAGGGALAGRHALTLVFYPPDRIHRDRDNLLARMKSGIDGMADALGINDREFDPITISMGEPRRGQPCVHITITAYPASEEPRT